MWISNKDQYLLRWPYKTWTLIQFNKLPSKTNTNPLLQGIEDANETESLLQWMPSKDHNGQILTCRAEHPNFNHSSIESKLPLNVYCEYRKFIFIFLFYYMVLNTGISFVTDFRIFFAILSKQIIEISTRTNHITPYLFWEFRFDR